MPAVMEVPNKTFQWMFVMIMTETCSHRKAHNIYGLDGKSHVSWSKRFAYLKDLYNH
jgi:hypothetical protein